MDIEKNIHEYIYGNELSSGIKPLERYASFDYCFNYFRAFHEENSYKDLASPQYLQTSCFQLGFYLASWGMLRGSSFLLRKSAKVYEPVIKAISQADSILWELDVNAYTSSNIEMILDFKKTIARNLEHGNGATDTLVTKIMLGVFGNVPAFDSYFRRGLGVNTFNKQSLTKLFRFYQNNAEIIDKHRLPTLDFVTGKPTPRHYTRAKVIDMIFFIEGSKL